MSALTSTFKCDPTVLSALGQSVSNLVPHISERYSRMNDDDFEKAVKNPLAIRYYHELERWNNLQLTNSPFSLRTKCPQMDTQFPTLFFKNRQGNLGFVKFVLEIRYGSGIGIPTIYDLWSYEFNITQRRRSYSESNQSVISFQGVSNESICVKVLNDLYAIAYRINNNGNEWIADNTHYESFLKDVYFKGGYIVDANTDATANLNRSYTVALDSKALDKLGRSWDFAPNRLITDYHDAARASLKKKKAQAQIEAAEKKKKVLEARELKRQEAAKRQIARDLRASLKKKKIKIDPKILEAEELLRKDPTKALQNLAGFLND